MHLKKDLLNQDTIQLSIALFGTFCKNCIKGVRVKLYKLLFIGPMIKLQNNEIIIERKLKYEVEFTKEDYELFF